LVSSASNDGYIGNVLSPGCCIATLSDPRAYSPSR